MTQTVVTVSNTAQFNAAVVAASQAGSGPETILLAPGVYDGLQIYNKTIAASLTIQSEYAARPAVLEDFRLQLTNNVTVQGVTFSNTQLSNAYGNAEAQIFDSNNIAIKNSTFTGNPSDQTAAIAGNGIYVNGGSNISVSSNMFEYLHVGLVHTNADGLTVSGNVFQYIFNDGVDGGNSNNVSILGNYFTNMHMDPTDTEHPDAIQFWTASNTSNTENITVEYNTYVRGVGAAVQGIFITSQNGFGYDNVTVEHNSISGAAYNGIWVDSASNVTVENNVVQPYADMISRLILSSDSSGVVQSNEVGTQLVQLDPVTVSESANTTLAAIANPTVSTFVSAMAAINTAGSVQPSTTTGATAVAHSLTNFLTVISRI
ncbi:MAG TPA: right-handed parallel beta-helix repeat-containing protein [Caulobacteraceae bacterium]|jgi:parallel beta-helix repeat protein|nr:right-handed parallel beta-helix repeat-containing protein [Caulobacteraceae bacterium]